MKINHLDLFSGIGGFHLGFERAGFEITSYFSEIDKHAIAVYKHQFPSSTHVGSITNVRGRDLPTINLITFGSPCQDFSLAGSRKGMEGERSSLVLEAIRLISECRPSVFIWENVKGTFSSNDGADFWAIVQAFANIGGYRLEWQLLNTSWFLPQNRERIYLVGYSSTPTGNWQGVFPIGEETGKFGKIRQTASLTGGQLGRVLDPSGIGYALSACDYKDPMKVEVKEVEGLPMIGAFRGRNPENPSDRTTGQPTIQRLEINKNFISNTLTSVEKDNIVVESKIKFIGAVSEKKWVEDGKHLSRNYSQGNRVYGEDGIAPTLSSQMGGKSNGGGLVGIKLEEESKDFSNSLEEAIERNSLVRPVQIGQSNKTFAAESGTLIGKENQDAFTIRAANPNGVCVKPNYTYEKVNETIRRNNFIEGEVKAMDLYNKTLRDESPALTQPEHNGISLFDGYRIRRLTPIECERLQGFPDDHTAFGNYDGEVKPMPKTHRYKQCGNAVTVDVVEAVAKKCLPLFV